MGRRWQQVKGSSFSCSDAAIVRLQLCAPTFRRLGIKPQHIWICQNITDSRLFSRLWCDRKISVNKCESGVKLHLAVEERREAAVWKRNRWEMGFVENCVHLFRFLLPNQLSKEASIGHFDKSLSDQTFSIFCFFQVYAFFYLCLYL